MSEIEIKAYKHVDSLAPDLMTDGFLYYGHQVREAFLAGYAANTIPPAVRESAVRLSKLAKGLWLLETKAVNDDINKDILLLCQHVLGRGQV